MPTTRIAIAALAGSLSFPAFADNAIIEDAIKSRPDLSSFYEAFVSSGVSRELSPDKSYSVFAPTNDAFAKLTQNQYPCLYSSACRGEIADIVRNHIVEGEVHVTDTAKQKGGIYSIDRRFITIAEPTNNSYIADGKEITSMNQLMGAMLYKINGVIASERELTSLQYPQYAYAGEQVTTTTRRVVSDPACVGADCPAMVQETTTVRETTPVLVPVPAH